MKRFVYVALCTLLFGLIAACGATPAPAASPAPAPAARRAGAGIPMDNTNRIKLTAKPEKRYTVWK